MQRMKNSTSRHRVKTERLFHGIALIRKLFTDVPVHFHRRTGDLADTEARGHSDPPVLGLCAVFSVKDIVHILRKTFTGPAHNQNPRETSLPVSMQSCFFQHIIQSFFRQNKHIRHRTVNIFFTGTVFVDPGKRNCTGNI